MVHSPPTLQHIGAASYLAAFVLGLTCLAGCTVISDDAYNARLAQGHGGTSADGGLTYGGLTDGGLTDGGVDDTGCDIQTWYEDADSDGLGNPDRTIEACYPTTGYVDNADDCDDTDASVGLAETFYVDVDGDGFGLATDTQQSCSLPTGYAVRLGDCDDGDSSVNPDAIETCATSADDDCDGSTNSQDAVDCVPVYADGDDDGYGDASLAECWCQPPVGFVAAADDCDDSDAAVSPDATEVCLDGVDNDCDGVGCQLSGSWADVDADATLTGAGASSAGDLVVMLGDLNGDGQADLGVSAPDYVDGSTAAGAVWIALGPVSGALDLTTDAAGILVGQAAGDRAGRSLASLDDVNGDGYPELLIGASAADSAAPDGGVVYVVFGPATGASSLADADRSLAGGASYLYAGRAVAGLADATGDGVADLIVGTPNDHNGGISAGAAYLLAGPFDGTGSVESDAVASFWGEAAGDAAGRGLAAVGDVDGDGLSDTLIGGYHDDAGGSNAGAAYLVAGGSSGSISLADAQLRMYGVAAGDIAGIAVAAAGDVNGDGVADLLVGAPGNDDAANSAGAAYLIYGGLSGSISLADADVSMLGQAADDQAGAALSTAGDQDGDGADEILIGAPGSDRAVVDGGAVYLLYAPATGSLGLGDAQLVIEGSDAGLGAALAGGQDLDGDGNPDLALGAALAAGGAGQAFIFSGGGL